MRGTFQNANLAEDVSNRATMVAETQHLGDSGGKEKSCC
jgi:hypothetical protein